MLEELLKEIIFKNVDDKECSKELIETIRPMELALIEKAKEEERERIYKGLIAMGRIKSEDFGIIELFNPEI